MYAGHLVYAVRGVLFARAFDVSRLAVTSGPLPILEGVLRSTAAPSTGAAHAGISDAGALFYIPGPVTPAGANRRLVFVDRAGTIEPLKVPDAAQHIDAAAYLRGQKRISDLVARWPFNRIAAVITAIFWQCADGTKPAERLTTAESGTVHVPEAWSPDGRTMLFGSIKGAVTELWTLSIADGKTAPFPGVRSAVATAAAYSPDGRWVTYSIRESPEQNNALYVQPFPPTGAKYLIAERVSAGRRFIVALPPQATEMALAPRIHVVLNWFEELKQRVPTN